MKSKEIYIPAGSVALLSGPPGSGKSSLKAKAKGFRDLDQAWLCTDDIRRQVLGTVTELDENGEEFDDIPQSANLEVFNILSQMLKARLNHGRTCIIDATTLNDAERKPFVQLAKSYGVPCKVLILDTSVEDCLAANEKRRTKVSSFRIREMSQPTALPPVVTTQGKMVKQTPPSGFQRSSQFAFELVSRNDVLVQQLPYLNGENYDVIGDVHGLYDELLALLTKAGWVFRDGHLSHPLGRKLLFLGDLVDRGPHSVEVVRLVRQAVRDGVAESLQGNHEDKLVRFVDTALREGIERWSSYANAETGVQFLKLADRQVLVEFLRTLPAYKLLDAGNGLKLAFVHANMSRFDAELSASGDMVFGQSGFRREDTDAKYEVRFEKGLNEWVLIRGHLPQTSAQEHVFSLERHPFQKGELVLLRLDEFLAKAREGFTLRESFDSTVLTQASTFDFEAVSEKWDMVKAMEGLVTEKLASRRLDASKMFRVYKYSKQTFWDNRWGDSPWLTKARGLVLDPAGTIVSHPFDKCFNFHENGAGDDLSDDAWVIAVDKLNGFLGIVAGNPFNKGELLVHTQGSFDSEFVDYIRSYLDVPPLRGNVGRFLSKNAVSLMFEVIHPEDPHIIEYAPEFMGLHLLGVRGLNLHDKAWREEDVDQAALEMGLRRPGWTRMQFGKLRAQIKDARTEGWMVRSDDEEQEHLLKIKTPYYLTTKFLGRLSQKRIAHLYGNPLDFKKTIDEEFYPLVDLLVEKVEKTKFLSMTNEERVPLVRELIDLML